MDNTLQHSLKKVYVVAEMACSHEGRSDLAKRIVDGAGGAGADAIQFQIWRAENVVVPSHPDFPRLRPIELTEESWQHLVEYSRDRYRDMQIVACVYDIGTVDFCQSLAIDAFKVHSADLANPMLIKHVAKTGKRIDLAIGASTLDEIREAVCWIRETSESDVWLMYGLQNFPTPTDVVHLRYMSKLQQLFELPVGYQDHSDAESEATFWLPAAAIGMGISIIEKHITHNRAQRGADYQAALNPDEFARFVQMVRELESAMGDGRPREFSDDDLKYRKYSKKSIVAVKELKAGHKLALTDLAFMRAPELGLPPNCVDRIVGKRTKEKIQALALIRELDIE